MSYPDEISPIEQKIREERRRQDEKWGEQNHDPMIWLAILTEEVGEAAKAALHSKNDFRPGSSWNAEKLAEYREELIQVAAVAVSMVECLDRDKWRGDR